MTSAQLMKPAGCAALAARLRGLATFAVPVLCLMLQACQPSPVPAPALATPYPQRQLWAVAPFVNESGVSTVDTARLADLFAKEVQQIDGLDAVPVNRVISAMRQMNIHAIASPAEASALMNVLDVDGLIIGTVTAYDPYKPPVLGAAVELHLRSVSQHRREVDPRAITHATAGEPSPGDLGPRNPVAQTAGVFDARNRQTLDLLQCYAANRTVPDSAYGSDIYLVNIELYTQFVSYQLMRNLLQFEQTRLSSIAQEEAPR